MACGDMCRAPLLNIRSFMSDNNKFTFRTVWSIIMAVLYIAMGGLIMFSGLILKYNFRDNNPQEDDFLIVRYILGVGIIGYGLFRAYRVYKYKK